MSMVMNNELTNVLAADTVTATVVQFDNEILFDFIMREL